MDGEPCPDIWSNESIVTMCYLRMRVYTRRVFMLMAAFSMKIHKR